MVRGSAARCPRPPGSNTAVIVTIMAIATMAIVSMSAAHAAAQPGQPYRPAGYVVAPAGTAVPVYIPSTRQASRRASVRSL